MKILIPLYVMLFYQGNLWAQKIFEAENEAVTVSSVIVLDDSANRSSFESINQQYQFRNGNKPLGRKWLRSELLAGGGTCIMFGVLIALPRTTTYWEESVFDNAWNNLKEAWTRPPRWDHDLFVINYVSHPISGSYYYNAIRSQGGTISQGFAFSAFQSTLWEYLLEAVAERPSIQDLIVTPLFGTLLGEGIHRLTLWSGKNGFSFVEKVFLCVFNPMYVANNGFRLKLKKVPD